MTYLKKNPDGNLYAGTDADGEFVWTTDRNAAAHFSEEYCKQHPYLNWEAADDITEGEHSLYRWQHDTLGGFESALWDALQRADKGNLARLEAGYPEHVAALRRFRHTPGYWDALRARIEGRV
jgi:hypothetical protein